MGQPPGGEDSEGGVSPFVGCPWRGSADNLEGPYPLSTLVTEVLNTSGGLRSLRTMREKWAQRQSLLDCGQYHVIEAQS